MDKKLNANATSNSQNDPLVHSFTSNKGNLFSVTFLFVLIFVVLLGIGSGYFLSQHATKPTLSSADIAKGAPIANGTVVGSNDTTTFKDTAEGVLQNGGQDGEGQYHLVRQGGASQYVYLTSSIVDLSKFVNKKIKVWGQTQQAQHVGWLMDVGRVEVE